MKSVAIVLLLSLCSTALAQRPISDEAKQQQKDEVSRLDDMNGRWRGSAWIMMPNGKRETLTQTERVGSMLDGAVKVVEGRGYDDAGETGFNALGVISYDSQKQQLTMRSYAQGNAGDFPFNVTDDGYTWEIPAGPAVIRYTATIKNGKWEEFGERVIPDAKPMRFFEMKLERLGDTDWPAAGKVKSE